MKKRKYQRGAMPKAEFMKLSTSQKKSEMVAWLMRKGKSLFEARQIVYRKFYYGDPFEREDWPWSLCHIFLDKKLEYLFISTKLIRDTHFGQLEFFSFLVKKTAFIRICYR